MPASAVHRDMLPDAAGRTVIIKRPPKERFIIVRKGKKRCGRMSCGGPAACVSCHVCR